MAARTRRERAPRTYLPGIADVRTYDDGQRAYLQLDAGCTDPDTHPAHEGHRS
jgi:hypothetical protein